MSSSRFVLALKPLEPLQPGFLRLLREFEAWARRLTCPSERNRPTAIHAGRILIKRLRAILWLVQPALDPVVRTEARCHLRQAAGLLAGPRDSAVVRETLKELALKTSDPNDLKALTKIRRTLPVMESPPLATLLRQAMEQVGASLLLLSKETEATRPWPEPSERLDKALRQFHRAGKRARRAETFTPHHEWRKKAKRLVYLLETIHPCPAPAMARFVRRLDQLQNTLGLAHDCAITRLQLPREATRPRRLLRRREKHFQRKAARHARHLRHWP